MDSRPLSFAARDLVRSSSGKASEHLARMGIRIPTIVITAHGDDKARERLQSAGVVAFLAKPLRNAVLLAAVNDARTRARS
jgi:FixJ family two-component response regulator